MKKCKILYIGNNLVEKTNYTTSMNILRALLVSEGYTVYESSSKGNKVLRLLDMCLAIFRYHRKVDYVLIDTFSTTNFYFALMSSQICRLCKLKYVPILRGGNLPYRLRQNRKLSALIFKNSFKNIAPSGYLRDEFEKEGYVSDLIPNVIPMVNYHFKKRSSLAPKLLYVRSFSKIYNPTQAIRVLYHLKKKYPDAHLCMIGPVKDDSFNEVKELIVELSLQDSVELTGALSKYEWHEKSKDFDVFINTTHFDNTPIGVIEAMALGLVVVSTNVGGMSYLIDHKKEGILVKRNDALAMSNAIINLIRSNAYHYTINARKKVEAFDWQIVKHQWIDILN